MRFLLKIAFWLALIAFFLPSTDDSERPGFNILAAFMGAQEAMSDMGGFCERSPLACDTGREVGSYVAARVGDGMAYAYQQVRGHVDGQPQPPAAIAAGPATQHPAASAGALIYSERPTAPRVTTDPMQTAAVAAEHVRQTAGLAALGMPSTNATPQASRAPSGSVDPAMILPPPARLVTPTPRP